MPIGSYADCGYTLQAACLETRASPPLPVRPWQQKQQCVCVLAGKIIAGEFKYETPRRHRPTVASREI